MKRTALALSLTSLALVACQPQEAAPPAPAPAPTPPLVVPAAPPAPAPTPAPAPVEPAALMSQPGADGTTWDLVRVAVTGQLLTVQFQVKPTPGKSMTLTSQRMTDVSLVDDATSQRYSVLKDDTGKYMASPLNSTGESLYLNTSKDMAAVVWFKFPAPPADSKTVSIHVPEVGPFDGVALKR